MDINTVGICITIFSAGAGAYFGLTKKLNKLAKNDEFILRNIETNKYGLWRIFRNYITPLWINYMKLKKRHDYLIDTLQLTNKGMKLEPNDAEMAEFEMKLREELKKKYENFKEFFELALRKHKFDESDDEELEME